MASRHVLISGFTQTLARPTGLEALWLRMLDELDPATHRIETPLEWRSDWPAVAEHLLRTRGRFWPLKVYAYSWGAGWGFVRLADELRRRGMSIRAAVLCDPVYRSGLLPPWLPLNPRSLMHWLCPPRIEVPPNVAEVWWFRQRLNRPRAHDVAAVDKSATAVHRPMTLMAEHAWMDDHAAFHRRALDVAKGAK